MFFFIFWPWNDLWWPQTKFVRYEIIKFEISKQFRSFWYMTCIVLINRYVFSHFFDLKMTSDDLRPIFLKQNYFHQNLRRISNILIYDMHMFDQRLCIFPFLTTKWPQMTSTAIWPYILTQKSYIWNQNWIWQQHLPLVFWHIVFEILTNYTSHDS